MNNPIGIHQKIINPYHFERGHAMTINNYGEDNKVSYPYIQRIKQYCEATGKDYDTILSEFPVKRTQAVSISQHGDNKQNLEKAQQLGNELLMQLQDLCEPNRAFIAGSVRRGKRRVKDLELVLDIPQKNRNQLALRLIEICTVHKGKWNGKYIKLKHNHTGIAIDLFLPQHHDYFRQLAIRTGSRDFSGKIARTWRSRGWVGTSNGLRKESECVQLRDSVWQCKEHNPTLPPAWTSEKHFFKWLGMDWVEPKDRH